MRTLNVYVGYDEREPEAYRVCTQALIRTSRDCVVIHPLLEDKMRELGYYHRQEIPGDMPGVRVDALDRRPFAHSHSWLRFLVPSLQRDGWALYMDGDMLPLDDIGKVFDMADKKYAVMCVHHNHVPEERWKMEGTPQGQYPRKNWSSFVLWNCEHPAHKALIHDDAVNRWSGRQLHGFAWLEKEEIGEIPPEWNWLDGSSDMNIAPKNVHFTRGGPWFDAWKHVHYAPLWDWENGLRELSYRYSVNPTFDAAWESSKNAK